LFEQTNEALADQSVVVDDEDPNWRYL